MTAPQPATPGSDGEVCTCGHFWRLHNAATEECFVWVQTEQGRAYCVCPSFRPAAPSEPVAVDLFGDGPRPVVHSDQSWSEALEKSGQPVESPAEAPEFPCGWCSGADEHRPDCPSWTPEPPAETQQEDDPCCTIDGGGRCNDCPALAARPSADTETLRERLAALADEWDEDSRDALKIGAAARDRGDREVHRINARHARVAHHAASQLRAALDGSR